MRVQPSSPAKKATTPKLAKREVLARDGPVTAWEVDVFSYVHSYKGFHERRSMACLVVDGEFTEPVEGISKFSVQVSPDAIKGDTESSSVGSLLQTKPQLQFVGSLTQDEFRAVLALATTGNLREFACNMEQPHHGDARVFSFGFSSQRSNDSE